MSGKLKLAFVGGSQCHAALYEADLDDLYVVRQFLWRPIRAWTLRR